jgi:hypothetical protein
MMMQKSVETRWFYPGTIPAQVVLWFQDGLAMSEPSRIDTYLHTPGVRDLGIKLREGRIEIKQRTGIFGLNTFHPRATGMVESWHKWSFLLNAADAETDMQTGFWIPVSKERMTRRYHIMPDGSLRAIPAWLFPLQRSSIEIANIILAGAAWWSFGLEVIGTDADLVKVLQTTAALVFKKSGFTDFRGEESYSYPQWLDLRYPTSA